MNLERYIEQQKEYHEIVKKELQQGRKRSHWMWFIFPQIRGLGISYMSQYYAIANIEEAKAYMCNEYLRNNYLELCDILLHQNTNDPVEIFGSIDALKLQSSLTLFHIVDNSEKLITEVLNKYYNGKLDEKTIELVNTN